MKRLSLRCDQCGASSSGLECHQCARDLTALWLPFRVAVPLGRRGWRLLLEGDVERARDHLRTAHDIVGGERFRELLAWAEFLAGNVEVAFSHWHGAPPNEASRQVELFNRALSSVETKGIDSALALLGECDARFLPANALKSRIVASQSEPFESKDPVARVSIRQLAAVAVTVLLLGAGGGWLYGYRSVASEVTQPEPPIAVGGDTVSDPSEGPTLAGNHEREALANLILAGFQDPDIDTALPFGPLDIDREPISSLAQQVSPSVRSELGRSWYLTAVLDDPPPEQRIDLLVASMALVGAGADEYWVDDALYETMLALQESDIDAASHLAALLSEYHPESMFVNSVTRDLLRE